jgi:hypothetical protein
MRRWAVLTILVANDSAWQILLGLGLPARPQPPRSRLEISQGGGYSPAVARYRPAPPRG